MLIANTGNRPAKNIRLIASKADVKKASSKNTGDSDISSGAQRCFFSNIVIPVLANGNIINSGFGSIGNDKGTWVNGKKIPITIEYYGLDSRKFISKIDLLLVDDKGFAQTFWQVSNK